MPTPDVFLARQPILDRRQSIVAYKLLFRAGDTPTAQISDDVAATATVIQHAFVDLGIAEVIGAAARVFINVSPKLLLHDAIELLPREQVVLELLDHQPIDAATVRRCRQLAEAGYALAVSARAALDPALAELVPLARIVTLDMQAHEIAAVPGLVRSLRRWPVEILAGKVDSRDKFDACFAAGVELFQGYFFAHPALLTGQRALSLEEAGLLRLLDLIVRDADVDDVQDAFKQAPNLAVQLLRLANSASVGATRPIGSVRDAIMVLGLSQLRRWLQLWVFSSHVHAHSQGRPSPLLELAALRGKLMELIAQQRYPFNRGAHDKAFMTGMLSALDALFQRPMAELLDTLRVPPDIAAAILHGEGELGRLLALVKATEDKSVVSDDCGVDDLLLLQIEAWHWVRNIDEPAA